MDQDLEKREYWRTLRRKIVAHFSLGEFKVLCHDVAVDYDELAGEEKVEKTNNLIGYLARRGGLERLIVVLKEERPKVDWEEIIPNAEQQIQDAERLIPLAKDDLILREYLERLEKYFSPHSLEEAKNDNQLREKINRLTQTYMQELDLWRRTRLVRYLGEHNLQNIVSLEGIDLNGADLSGANLQEVDLTNAKLTKSFLADCNLHRANLTNAYMDEAFLAGSDLRKADMRGALMGSAIFKGANLEGANLSFSYLTGAEFSDANLKDVILRERDVKKIDEFDGFMGAIITNPFFKSERVLWYLRYGNFDDTGLTIVLSDCNDLIDNNKSDDYTWYLFLRGTVYIANGNNQLAQIDLTKAIELFSSNKEKPVHLIEAYQSMYSLSTSREEIIDNQEKNAKLREILESAFFIRLHPNLPRGEMPAI